MQHNRATSLIPENPAVPLLLKIKEALETRGHDLDCDLITAAQTFIPIALAADAEAVEFNRVDALFAKGEVNEESVALAERRMNVANDRANCTARPILIAQARTLSGLLAKAAVVVWCRSDESFAPHSARRRQQVNDFEAALSVVRGVLAIEAILE